MMVAMHVLTVMSGYVSNAGATVCTVCVAGEYDDGFNTCTDCDDGSVSNAGATVCTVCAAGTYDDGSNACTDCDDGYVSNAGSTVCTMCARLERMMMAVIHVLM